MVLNAFLPMSISHFDPSAGKSLSPERLQRLLRAAVALDEPDFGLSDAEVAEFAALARHQPRKGGPDWSAVTDLDDAAVIALVRLFTLAEGRLPGWESGDRNPVVPLVALLKARGALPDDLNGWIRANTDNRFLPHGNLMDRL